MEQNNTLPTWKDALRIAKGLQEEYGLPIFAMTFKGSCSCCASPDDFNKQAYLDKSVAEKSWDEIDSYVILKNAHNCGGEARFFHTQSFREGGKTRTRRVWNEFGTVYDGCNDSVDQHVMYRLSESFTMERLRELLTRFVEGLNAVSGAEYEVLLPENENECATISLA